jgi:hypothetical protein
MSNDAIVIGGDYHVEVQNGSRSLWERTGNEIMEVEQDAHVDPDE